MADLVERLQDEANSLSSEAWRRPDGGQDLSLASMLMMEAAEALTACEAEAYRRGVEDAAMVADRFWNASVVPEARGESDVGASIRALTAKDPTP